MAFAVGTLLAGNGQQDKIAIGVLGLIGLILKLLGEKTLKLFISHLSTNVIRADESFAFAQDETGLLVQKNKSSARAG